MSNDVRKANIRPLVFGIATFLLLLVITQYVAYQRYHIIKRSEHEDLQHELDEAKGRFKDILNRSISSANTVAVIYKQFDELENFDSIVSQLIQYDTTVDFMNVSSGYVITHVYPREGNEMILGKSLLDYPFFRREVEIAIKNKEILFTGPYQMTDNRGVAIACRVPVFVDDSLKGLVSVITKLPTLMAQLPQFNNNARKFVYQLTKKNSLHSGVDSFFTGFHPRDENIISAYMPEGDWTLYIAYSDRYTPPNDAWWISVLGLLLSCSVALFVYNRAKLPLKLEGVVRKRTHDLGERVKELSTIFKVNEILKEDGRSEEEIFTRIVSILPSGWQHSDCCVATIRLGDKMFESSDPERRVAAQSVEFSLQDGRTGEITVVYTASMPLAAEGPFLAEERDLLNALAETIQVYFNKRINQEELLHSEARFRSAFEDAAIGMSITSLDGRWLMVNRALCELLGYTEAELKQLSFQDVSHPDDLAQDMAALSELLSGRIRYYRADKRYIRKDGAIVWVSLNVATVHDKNTRPLYFVTQIKNITEQVESQQKFQDLVERSLVGVYIIQDGRFVYVNPKIIEESGFSEAELLSSDITDFIFEDDLTTVQTNIQARLAGDQESSKYEVRVRTRNGKTLWAEMYGASTLFRGAPAVIGTIVNTSERKQLEIERQQMIQDLTQRNKDLEQFNHVLSHNVRSPLTTIMGLSQLIKESREDAERRFLLSGIDDSIQQLDEVIKDLNDILYVKSGLSEVVVPVDLQKVVADIRILLAGEIASSGAVIECDFSAVREIESVKPFIDSIFYNLISNAIRYRREGVTPRLVITSGRQEDKVLISFADNGQGIDMERYGDDMFVLYKRFHSDTEGRGLGLSMVKAQLESMKGDIRVTSEPGKGSTFTVVL